MKNLHLTRLFTIGFLSLISFYSFSQSITEFHYDNIGADVNEFIEVTLPAGADPMCYTIYLVNGGDNDEYREVDLPAGPSSAGCTGGTTDIYHVPESGIQQGPDGIALVDACATPPAVVEFISYGGTLTGASFGSFTGQNSTDIGITEGGSTPTTASLAFDGTMWVVADPATPGLPNDGSICDGGSVCSMTDLAISVTECLMDDFSYDICATVANGSGDYELIEVGATNTIISSISTFPDGPVCFQVTIVGPTTASTIDLNIVDAADGTCIAAMPVTLNILECPSVSAEVYISELSYDPCAAQGTDAQCEYIIISNDGAVPVDISDYTITNAFTYTFPTGTIIPSGESISLGISANCAGLSTFDLSGGWSGSMTNGTAENLELNDASGANIFSVTYPLNIADGDCDAICVTNDGMTSACMSSLDLGGGTCPDLSGETPVAVVVNSICPAGNTTPTGGSIAAPISDCPPLSFLEYSEDGITWSTSIPIYDQAGPPQFIQTRCVCDDDPTMVSDATAAISTVPGTCDGCSPFISTFPANGN